MGIFLKTDLARLIEDIKGGNFEGSGLILMILLMKAILRVMVVSLTLVV